MQNFVRVLDGALYIVRDHDNGYAGIPIELFYQAIELSSHHRVKPGHRLVKQKQLFCGAERTREQNPLLLAAGELAV